MNMWKRIFIPATLLSCIFALDSITGAAAWAQQELLVSAAASLTDAFNEVGKRFEAANPGTKVILNFAASGALLQQIDKGAPVDVFASADQKTMNQAGERKLILAETRKDFAGNELVLIVPKDYEPPINSLKDLAQERVWRITLGNPESVPVGRYAEEALRNAGLWESLKPKFVFADSVRQALAYVRRGEVDAGFVFATDAATSRNMVQVASVVEGHQPIRYPVAVVAGTKNRALSQRFIDFLLGSEGRGILSSYGFGKP